MLVDDGKLGMKLEQCNVGSICFTNMLSLLSELVVRVDTQTDTVTCIPMCNEVLRRIKSIFLQRPTHTLGDSVIN